MFSKTKLTNYVSGSDKLVFAAIWKTLVQDRGRMPPNSRGCQPISRFQPPNIYSLCFRDLWDEKTISAANILRPYSQGAIETIGEFYVFGRRMKDWARISFPSQCVKESPLSNFASDSVLKKYSEKDLDDFLRSLEFLKIPRRFTITRGGYMGLAHYQTEVGDSICLLQGCSVPMLLRKCEGGYRVIGEAYVHGMMNGESWKRRRKEKQKVFALM